MCSLMRPTLQGRVCLLVSFPSCLKNKLKMKIDGSMKGRKYWRKKVKLWPLLFILVSPPKEEEF